MSKAFFLTTIMFLSLLKCGNCTTSATDFLIYCNDAIHAIDSKKNTTREESFNVGMCYGLIEGVLNSILGLDGKLPDNMRICLPKETMKAHQFARIYVKYVKDNPKELHESASFLIYSSLIKSFPCQATQP